MGLFGGRTKVDLEVDKGSLKPGESVKLMAELSGKEDEKVSDVVAELVREDYFKKEFTQIVDDVEFSSETEGTRESIVATRSLTGKGGLALGQHTATLKLPVKSPPSTAGLVGWKARVRLIRDQGKDRSSERALRVVTAPGAYKGKLTAWQKAVESSNNKSAKELSWKLAGNKRSFHAGQPIQGELVVKPKQSLEPELISINLITDILVDGAGCVQDLNDSAPWGVFEQTEDPDPIPAGSSTSIPFELISDKEAPPTAALPDGRNRIWYLTAWVGDLAAEEGLESFRVIELSPP